MSEVRIVVVGAGVIGLTTALTLARSRKHNYTITVLSKHMPGDYDIEYASPWAGANYLPVGTRGSLLQKLEQATWPELERIVKEVPEAGVHFQETIVYGRKKDEGTPTGEWFRELVREDAWWRDVVPNFRILPRSSLPPDCSTGTSFTSVCINTAIYLPWLLGQCLKHGVVFQRAILPSLSSARTLHHSGKPAHIIINCTGLGALTLADVKDTNVYPARGQIVLVRNAPGAMYTVSGTDDGADEATYVMQRAAGGGTILGGCLQAGSWESAPDPNLANRIMQRSVELCPALVPRTGKVTELSVVRHGVGLRPMRKGGPRVERERGVDGGWVVHQYGHGGYGYQSSWGSAWEAERLVEGILGEGERERAKL
ncbi:FAD dependent oxidoreductase [Westerdykella ornata]|uniref:FAD dependent oxidoreductase n=1 Tax=Westerdykella ornata TaxID=318751 RepID=A0A6A6JBJ0_WESOR|nr:FAD dependent oxidoreductase [Westerdykella ornata]KAF2273006.1 FAD dependent oxidoreductase [Westerdykella ornata]